MVHVISYMDQTSGMCGGMCPCISMHQFFNCYLAASQPTLGHYQGDSLTNLMLITALQPFRPEGHWEPHKEVGSLSLAKNLVGF